MERATATATGRRHARTGSVSVAELIGKQPSRSGPASGRAPAISVELIGEGRPCGGRSSGDLFGGDLGAGPLGDGSALRPEPHRVRRAARVVGWITGALVLVTSVVAAAVLAEQRGAVVQHLGVEILPAMSGASALRPDLLSAELGGTAVVDSGLVVDGPLPVPQPATPEVVVGPRPQVEVVRRFFELLPTRPASASALLSPDLVGASPADFVESWSLITAIAVESVANRPDGTVLAVVSMRERDGGLLRVEQLFRLTGVSAPRIVGAEVISAQRS
ncbi:hypothetical protein [Actinosynnema mirum]|uniref:Uncharacterized protein n=1 Tax=Actinosynnema mirum (strain ATCC 29888 / DSM 43827 / JCM 3225 / NBRC 14064 / NCIMB 13271 / NRRL B-12336 / IMRU 3971 / 101) TaxID=446462 RepID=C6WLT3_ACTMD|nr:hypothetical protein [Actinosynnema mirum]ACU40318.1 hypothetical protein Amir_6518 [Actinosynnema mirum DSM 43827]